MRILLRTCPSRLNNPDDKCTKFFRQSRFRLKEAIINIFEKGVNSGEFIQIEIYATANVMLAMINGLMRQKLAALDALKGVEFPLREYAGGGIRLLARTNELSENFLNKIKHSKRRRSGRKNLARDLEHLPASAALAYNLKDADYVSIVRGSLVK